MEFCYFGFISVHGILNRKTQNCFVNNMPGNK